jgi:hypothetical protein
MEFLYQTQKNKKFGRKYLASKWLMERRILKTKPCFISSTSSNCEVHIMTYDLDWLMALWAAKSFFIYSKVSWPLIWHQGGNLRGWRREFMQNFFPGSRFYSSGLADEMVEPELNKLGLRNCLNARRRFTLMRKLIDPLILSKSRNVLVFDSDVLFFGFPGEIVSLGNGISRYPTYNRDCACYYSIDALTSQKKYGIDLVSHINSGLVLMPVNHVDWDFIEKLLGDEQITADWWLVEQTLHALLASRDGYNFFPDTYPVSVQPGLSTKSGQLLISKHYAGFPRPLMFREGMSELWKRGEFR